MSVSERDRTICCQCDTMFIQYTNDCCHSLVFFTNIDIFRNSFYLSLNFAIALLFSDWAMSM